MVSRYILSDKDTSSLKHTSCNFGYQVTSARVGLQSFFLWPEKPSIELKIPIYSAKSIPILRGKKLKRTQEWTFLVIIHESIFTGSAEKQGHWLVAEEVIHTLPPERPCLMVTQGLSTTWEDTGPGSLYLSLLYLHYSVSKASLHSVMMDRKPWSPVESWAWLAS